MNEVTADSLIPYDEIVQEALRSVVRRVLESVERNGGLPGQHHFYVAFRTRFPGVEMPRHLHERYPEEMTIVLQHRYWDLVVDENHFEIGLSFNQVPAKLSIPFAAVTGFVDPAVNFALQFQARTGSDDAISLVSAPDEAAEPSRSPDDPAPPAGSPSGSNVLAFPTSRKK